MWNHCPLPTVCKVEKPSHLTEDFSIHTVPTLSLENHQDGLYNSFNGLDDLKVAQ